MSYLITANNTNDFNILPGAVVLTSSVGAGPLRLTSFNIQIGDGSKTLDASSDYTINVVVSNATDSRTVYRSEPALLFRTGDEKIDIQIGPILLDPTKSYTVHITSSNVLDTDVTVSTRMIDETPLLDRRYVDPLAPPKAGVTSPRRIEFNASVSGPFYARIAGFGDVAFAEQVVSGDWAIANTAFSALSAGNHTILVKRGIAASPNNSDLVLGYMEMYWSGTTWHPITSESPELALQASQTASAIASALADDFSDIEAGVAVNTAALGVIAGHTTAIKTKTDLMTVNGDGTVDANIGAFFGSADWFGKTWDDVLGDVHDVLRGDTVRSGDIDSIKRPNGVVGLTVSDTGSGRTYTVV